MFDRASVSPWRWVALIVLLAQVSSTSAQVPDTPQEPVQLPNVRLAELSPSDGANDPALNGHLEKLVDRFRTFADDPDAPFNRYTAARDVATFLVGRLLEPAVTERLLHLSVQEGREVLRTEIAAARTYLELAEASYVNFAAESEPTTTQSYDFAVFRSVTMAICDLLDQAPQPTDTGESSDRDERLRRLAVDLAIATEGRSVEEVAASTLLQALLLDAAREFDRALLTLPPFEGKTATSANRWSYLSSILRCRLWVKSRPAADSGAYAMAIAQLLQLEDAAYFAFTDEAAQQQAARAAAWVRLQIVDDWAKALKAADKDEAWQWCQEGRRRIIDDYFANPESNTLLRLEETFPFQSISAGPAPTEEAVQVD